MMELEKAKADLLVKRTKHENKVAELKARKEACDQAIVLRKEKEAKARDEEIKFLKY